MTVDNSSQLLCIYADAIYTNSRWMHIALFYQFFAGIAALLMSALLTIAVVFATALHFNVRVLLICFCTAIMVANIGLLLSSIYFLSVIFICNYSDADRCEMLLFNHTDCSGLKSVFHTGALTVILSTIFLAIERCVATAKYETYEQQQHRWIGVLLAVIQGASWFPIVFNIAKYPVFDVELPYCAPELFNPSGARQVQLFIIVLQLLALSIFIVLWHHNRQRMGTYQFQNVANPLSARFQLRENVATTRLMTPIVVTNSSLLFSHLFVLHFAMPPFQISRRLPSTVETLEAIARFAPFEEAQTCLWPLFTLGLFYLLPRFGVHIRRSLGRIGLVGACCAVDDGHVDVFGIETTRNTYFAALDKQLGNLGMKKHDQLGAM